MIRKKINNIQRILADPAYRLESLRSRGLYTHMSDEDFIKKKWKVRMHYELNLDNPQTFNEKLQWLKIHDRNPLYRQLADKYEVKKYIASVVGDEYILPTLGIWDCFEDIEFASLPEQFVLKCTHDSGGLVIVKDKNAFDVKAAKKKINSCLKQNYYYVGREWPYKNITPRIIAENYMTDESGTELKDYKIFCFNGHAEYVEVDFNRFIEHKLNPYDFNWNPLNFCDKSKNDYSANIPKPERLEDMRRIAEELSRDIDFLRVDFYSIYDQIYVGELTLYPGSGFIEFDPPETDLYYGDKLILHGFKK